MKEVDGVLVESMVRHCDSGLGAVAVEKRDCQNERVVEKIFFFKGNIQGGQLRTFEVDTRLVDDSAIQAGP